MRPAVFDTILKLRNTTFQKVDLFPSSGEGVENICSVGSCVLWFLEYWTMDRVQKPKVSSQLNLQTYFYINMY
jgi:hypothetical protein